MAKGQRTQPDRTDACAPHEARRNLPDERALESATAAPPWLMREKGVVPERVAGGFNRSAPMQRIRASDRQGTVLKARRVGGVRAPGFRSTVLDTSTPRRHPRDTPEDSPAEPAGLVVHAQQGTSWRTPTRQPA